MKKGTEGTPRKWTKAEHDRKRKARKAARKSRKANR